MAKNVFSVPIFIIVFRETLEAAIIVSVLLSLVEQLVTASPTSPATTSTEATRNSDTDSKDATETRLPTTLVEDDSIHRRRLLRRMRIQIFFGAGLGLFISLAIGAAFIAVWFTQASNLWKRAETLWEGIFNMIASLMIFVMGVTMLKIDRAKVKWRVKLEKAFDGSNVDRKAKTGKWMLFVLPLVTLLREGIEAVVFVGGVSLGQPAASIPIAAIVGVICGIVCGYLIYQFASRTALTVFLVVMTNFLLLIGAGLFSKAIGRYEAYSFSRLLGSTADDAEGTGPGSYRVQGNVWHLDCCSANGWTIFKAIFGWSNNGSLGTILSYVFYWIAVIVTLIYMKFSEGRTKVFKYESSISKIRKERRERRSANHDHDVQEKDKQEVSGMGISELSR